MKGWRQKKRMWRKGENERNTKRKPGERNIYNGGAHGVMVIVIGNGHGNMSSNPGWDWLHFT